MSANFRASAPVVLGLTVLALLAGGCAHSGANAPPGADPSAMSLAEYDQARDLWLNRNSPREALAHALGAVDLDPDNAEAAHLVALLYLDFCRRSPAECRMVEAERYAKLAVNAKENFREAENTLGVVLIHRKKYQEAIRVLTPLSRDILYSTPENAWGNLGWALLESGKVDEAIIALRRSVAAQPKFCVGFYRLGIAYQRKKLDHQALTALTRALEGSDPRCQGLQAAYAARASVYMRLGEAAAARADADRCVALGTDSTNVHDCRSILEKLE